MEPGIMASMDLPKPIPLEVKTGALRASGLCKSFGNTPVLHDVSLELLPGMVTTVMGPSGSGKTTLLAILCGLVRPDAGTVTFMGCDLWHEKYTDEDRERLRRRHCGIILQKSNLLPALTAQQQLEIALEWASEVPRRRIDSRARRMLTRVGLGNRLESRPHQLSGGEQQRVAVARALAKRPAILFADEPTASLDWKANGKHVFRLLRRAAHDPKAPATVLVVSHDPRISKASDRVLHMADGRLREG
jgi:putative ABC transport system ATP-binding protein